MKKTKFSLKQLLLGAMLIGSSLGILGRVYIKEDQVIQKLSVDYLRNMNPDIKYVHLRREDYQGKYALLVGYNPTIFNCLEVNRSTEYVYNPGTFLLDSIIDTEYYLDFPELNTQRTRRSDEITSQDQQKFRVYLNRILE
jgi:hypothetical protein